MPNADRLMSGSPMTVNGVASAGPQHAARVGERRWSGRARWSRPKLITTASARLGERQRLGVALAERDRPDSARAASDHRRREVEA